MSDTNRPAGERAPPTAAASPKDQSRVLAETVVASFLDRLTVEAERRGGWLSVGDIHDLSHEFEKKTEALQAVFEESFEAYVRIRERAVWNQARRYPFDRLIVRKFERLFVGEGGRAFGDGALSRRMLPGFFLAMNLMLGDDVIEDYQARCRAIVERLQEKSGDAFEWNDAHQDPEAGRVTLDAVAAMAAYFGNLEKRTAWFLAIINDHLAPPDTAREGQATVTWRFTEGAFHQFLAALFADVRQTMATERGRLAITRSHGGEACAALWDILEELEALRAGGEGA
jgi:hypothetical protein